MRPGDGEPGLLKNKDLKWILILNLLSVWIQTHHFTFASVKCGYIITPTAHDQAGERNGMKHINNLVSAHN